MSRHVLIDASNLRHGGGVQVGASFLDELAHLAADEEARQRFPWLDSVDVEASSAVLSNISADTRNSLRISACDRRPVHLGQWFRRPRHAVAFSVFGPVYGRPRGLRSIVGFADVTSIYPRPPQLPALRRVAAVRAGVRRFVSRRLFGRAHRLVVEAPHVKNQLVNGWGLDPDVIDVVPNCVNETVRGGVQPVQERSGWCYITRGYPHKNIDLLGAVGTALRRRGVDDVTFTLTLDPAEWNGLSPETRSCALNLGPVTVSDVPRIYGASEGSVFPSLLECFSVTPLEALATGTPLVASRRAFVSDVCGDAAVYVEPDDPEAWADAIMAVRSDPSLRSGLVARGRARVEAGPTARDRAWAYLSIIHSELTAR